MLTLRADSENCAWTFSAGIPLTITVTTTRLSVCTAGSTSTQLVQYACCARGSTNLVPVVCNAQRSRGGHACRCAVLLCVDVAKSVTMDDTLTTPQPTPLHARHLAATRHLSATDSELAGFQQRIDDLVSENTALYQQLEATLSSTHSTDDKLVHLLNAATIYNNALTSANDALAEENMHIKTKLDRYDFGQTKKLIQAFDDGLLHLVFQSRGRDSRVSHAIGTVEGGGCARSPTAVGQRTPIVFNRT